MVRAKPLILAVLLVLMGVSSPFQGVRSHQLDDRSAVLIDVERPSLDAASVNPLARLGGMGSLVAFVFLGFLLHPGSAALLRRPFWRREEELCSWPELPEPGAAQLGLDASLLLSANEGPSIDQLEEVPSGHVLFASSQQAAQVEEVANDWAYPLQAPESAPGSSQGGGARRAFRCRKNLEQSAVYRNRSWPGRTAQWAPLLIALVPLLAVLLPALAGFDLALAAGENEAAVKLELAGEGAQGSATAVKLLVVLTLLAVAPAIVLSMTSFTRMIIVFSLTRQALGVQQAPPNQILVGLALFLTWYVMAPTFEQVNEVAVQPYQAGVLSEAEAVEAAMGPMKRFMLRNTRENDLGLFMRLSKIDRPQTRADVPARVLVPAFIISELKTAFQIGFLIYVPFLIIDIVVSVVLLAMGMMVLPPVVISLPFKLLLFVFVDGWNLLVGSMVQSFS